MPSVIIQEPIIINYKSSDLEKYIEGQLGQKELRLGEPRFIVNKDLQEIGIIRKTHNSNKEGHYITYGLSCTSDDGELFDKYGNIRIKNFIDYFSKINASPARCGIERIEHIGLSLENSLFGLQRYKIRSSKSEIENFTDILDFPEEYDIFSGDKFHCSYSDVPEFLINKLIKFYVEANYSVWKNLIQEDD